MSTATISVAQEATTETLLETSVSSVTDDHRYALLAARTGLEPALAARYETNPLDVLAEFGLYASEPVYAGGMPKGAGTARGLMIEDLSSNDGGFVGGCCGSSACPLPYPYPYPPLHH